ncbi:MAG: mechanosensitive ion channel family protein [Bosea sp. (in: a-proteobacteria)]
MSDQNSDDTFSLAFETVHRVVERVEQGLSRRLNSITEAWSGFDQTFGAMAAVPGVFVGLALVSVLLGTSTFLVFGGVRALLKHRDPSAGFLIRACDLLAAFTCSSIVGVVLARIAHAGPSPSQTTLTIITVATAIGTTLLTAQSMLINRLSVRKSGVAGPRALRFVRQLNTVIAYAIAGGASVSILRAWGASPAARDLFGSVLVATPVTLALIFVTFVHRSTLVALVAGPKPRSKRRLRIARRWPILLMLIVGLTFVSAQIAYTLGTPLPGVAIVATLAFVIAIPFLDRILKGWAAAARTTSDMYTSRLALRMTVRPALLAVIGSLLCALWIGPLVSEQSGGLHRFAYLAVTLAILGLCTAFFWNLIAIASSRALQQDHGAEIYDEETLEPRTRFQTLAPLLAGVGRWTVVSLAVLSALIVLGINVWPIVTGLSVFGIAIGFGSQALVKDIVSGVFFLIDDAFRQGEYIETSGAKGVVEKISIRSVSLRHQRGALATIPYGSIGKIQNFSRDWVIEKLLFRVAIDTDVEVVRKLFKKIGQDLAVDPELVPDLIEPFKSQGIGELEDGTLVIRGKFKAKAGRQSLIRRKVLAAVHRAFQEQGVRAVPKPLDAAKSGF